MAGFFSSGTSNATTRTSPWKGQAPYLLQLFRQAQNLYNGPAPKYYPGSTVARFSPQQLMSFRLGERRALNGNATLNAGQKYTRDVINGKYSGDPYQGQVYNNIQSKVMPSVNSMFSAAGRYGSGANQGELTKSLTSAFAPYASDMYQRGLDRRSAAVNDAFRFADQDYKDLGILENIGQKKQSLAQNELNDSVARWNYYQNLPQDRLKDYAGMITGNYGSTTRTPQYQPSTFSQLIGGGLGIASLLGGLF